MLGYDCIVKQQQLYLFMVTRVIWSLLYCPCVSQEAIGTTAGYSSFRFSLSLAVHLALVAIKWNQKLWQLESVSPGDYCECLHVIQWI